jgi:hypothetical protein
MNEVSVFSYQQSTAATIADKTDEVLQQFAASFVAITDLKLLEETSSANFNIESTLIAAEEGSGGGNALWPTSGLIYPTGV